MNIFAINQDSIKSARGLCNKHIVKMPTETLGMLAFAFPENEAPVRNKRSHRHWSHPCSKWLRQSNLNFEWLSLHGLALCQEYSKRYKREHATESKINWCVNNLRYLTFPQKSLTPFARCFSEFKPYLDANVPDTVKAYQEFYKLDKASFARWPSISHIPDWFLSFLQEKELNPNNFVDKSFRDGQYTKR